MKIRTGHIVFDEKIKYSDLISVYREVFEKFIEEAGIKKDRETIEALREYDISLIKSNKKPAGYNHAGDLKLIFPIEKNELYVSIPGEKRNEDKKIKQIINDISEIFNEHNIKHSISWNKLPQIQRYFPALPLLDEVY